MIISGFGTLFSGGSTSSVLQKANVNIVSDTVCSQSYGSLDDSTICASGTNDQNQPTDTCQVYCNIHVDCRFLN